MKEYGTIMKMGNFEIGVMMALQLMIAMQASRQSAAQMTPTLPQKERSVHPKVIADDTGWVRPFYLWRNKSTILAFQGDTDPEVLKGVEEYHLNTGRLRRLEALNKGWQEHEHLYYRIATGDKEAKEQFNHGSFILWPALSPDGKWIVWFARLAYASGLEGMWMTASLDGKHWADLPKGLRGEGSVGSLAWSHNSRSWIGLFGYKPAGFVYDVTTQQEHPFDVSSGVTPPKIPDFSWNLVAQRSNGHLLLTLLNRGDHLNNDILFADIPGERQSGTPKQWTIHIPSNAVASEYALAPSGDRLLWNLYFGASGDPADPLKPDTSPEQPHREIWLSNLDGSQMRRVGGLTFDTPNYGELSLMGLQWVPDGKHISYIYDRKLYLVALP